ncbi:hypothetical protein EV363DRAFT_1160330 [Boletus edulis]|nr:hypothetical protein EV363DRAFT_1160330 [Boletus edulis]
MYTLIPRFVLSLRELYARDVRRGSGIDTGFGLSLSSSDAGIVFAGDEQNEELEEVMAMDFWASQEV